LCAAGIALTSPQNDAGGSPEPPPPLELTVQVEEAESDAPVVSWAVTATLEVPAAATLNVAMTVPAARQREGRHQRGSMRLRGLMDVLECVRYLCAGFFAARFRILIRFLFFALSDVLVPGFPGGPAEPDLPCLPGLMLRVPVFLAFPAWPGATFPWLLRASCGISRPRLQSITS
jgi:hypothetical protein